MEQRRREIFRLRDELASTEGADVSFYDFLGTKPSANQDDINKAYRKRSRVLHPDKVKQQFIAERSTGKDQKDKKTGSKPGVHVSKGPSKSEIAATAKAASDRFARLGLVANILRGPGRERYDHFLNNGFPTWKGTGYYYARFRPGLGTVLTTLFIFVGGGGHWLALYLSWNRQREFVGRYIKFARHAAWGDNLGIPGVEGTATPPVASGSDGVDPEAMPLNRRQRRMQEKDTKKDKSEKKPKSKRGSPASTPTGSTGIKKRVVAENGKILIVDSAGNVYLEQPDENGVNHEFLLDPNELPQPSIKDTALVRFPVWVFNQSAGRFLNKAPAEDASSEEGGEATPSSSDAEEDFEVLEKVKTSSYNGKSLKKKKSGRR
ncbi:putative endoplasmic reticulum located J-protein ERJ5 [Coleophoma crateriformis]|uniref:Putative endoplasmic reticulum located J-protein ERJ5 n=1 Tax=Coleophoma crateriformis TaxID=565419 RepID=A0A3D8QQU6_9HELO|nr:putative endoplasmic reticulum located J-protein ERJ5 [Coleophoma crateriformis]